MIAIFNELSLKMQAIKRYTYSQRDRPLRRCSSLHTVRRWGGWHQIDRGGGGARIDRRHEGGGRDARRGGRGAARQGGAAAAAAAAGAGGRRRRRRGWLPSAPSPLLTVHRALVLIGALPTLTAPTAAPALLSSVTAHDTGGAPGISDGDTISIRFSAMPATGSAELPSLSTKADVDRYFSFTTAIASDYTGAWSADGTTATITLHKVRNDSAPRRTYRWRGIGTAFYNNNKMLSTKH